MYEIFLNLKYAQTLQILLFLLTHSTGDEKLRMKRYAHGHKPGHLDILEQAVACTYVVNEKAYRNKY